MAKFPSKPQHGKSFVQEFGNSINQIIDYLPSLEVRGDQKSTYVTKSSKGTVIHATEQNPSTRGKEYFAGSGLILSGNTFNNAVTSGRFIEVTSAYAINCTLSGGNNIEITPNGVINCTLTGGGGGGGGYTYYADNYSLSSVNSTTFYTYDVLPFLTGAGGITVKRYGDAPGIGGRWGAGETPDTYHDNLIHSMAKGTVISCPVYLPSTGIAILDDPTSATYSKYVAITADFDYHAGTGISIDPTTRTINCTVEPGGGGETYYADESTIKLSSTNNTFYLYDVEPALTGEGDIKIGNYGFDGLRRITTISSTPYTGGDNISVDNYVISMTTTIPTKTSDLTNDSHFITINDVPPGTVYQGDNVTIAASGTNNNIFYVIDGVFAPLTTVVNLSTELSGHIDYVSSNIPLSTSELVNDVPFVTSSDLDAYYKVSAFNAVGDHLQYIPRLGRLNCTLTGGDWIQIDEQDNINCTLTNVSDLNNDAGYITTVDIPPSTTYIGTSGIVIEPILDENQQPTTSSFIGLSTKFYNDLTAISTRPATGDKILSSHNGTLSWETNTAGSNIPTPTANKVLSSNASNQIVWATNTGGSTPTPGEQNYNYIFSSGIYQATAGSKWIVRYPHIPIYWSERQEDAPWPEGWQPPKEPGSDAYFSQQWPLYQYYYDQPTEPALPCGFLCSLYTWAPGEYGSSKSHGHWDIILKLPNVSERTVVEVVNYTDTALIVVTDNQKQIIPQCFNNTIGDDQNYWSTNYPNYAYSFKHGDFNACCKIIFYYDPAPPYTPERTPYASGAMKQLTSGGCWFGQILY